MKNISAKTLNLFYKKVQKNGPLPEFNSLLGHCWIWTASLRSDGYGFFGTNKWTSTAHRVSYQIHYPEENIEGLDIDHLCLVRHCVNPKHLEAVSHKENCHRGFGFSGVNIRKTHCPKGHELSEENNAEKKVGRKCRICNLERVKIASKKKYWDNPELGRAISRAKNIKYRARKKNADQEPPPVS